MTALGDVLDSAASAGRIVRPGMDIDAIVDAEELAERVMPAGLRQVYQRANGIEFEGVDIIDLGEFVSFNELPERFHELPGAVIFGSDQGDGVFLLDPQDGLGEGPEAVHFNLLGEMTADGSRVVATDLAQFIALALDGALVLDGPRLGEVALERLFAAIEAHPDQIVLRPPLDYLRRLGPALEVVASAPSLVAFYRRCDGLTVLPAAADVVSMEEVAPVAETLDATGRPGALEVGRVEGFGLFVSTGGWRGLPANRLLVSPSAGALAGAAPLGRFADVLRSWIEGGGLA